MIQDHHVAENTLLSELHSETITKTVFIRGQYEQLAIRTQPNNKIFNKRKNKNGFMIYSHLPSEARRREE